MDALECRVGGEVTIKEGGEPAVITEVLTVVRLRRNGMNSGFYYRPEELEPYVRPLAVGDRVRHKRYRDRDGNPWDGVIIDTMGVMAVVRHADSFSVFPVNDLERIPAEETGK